MPTFKFTTTTKHTAARESKRRAKFIHHQAGWKGRKIRTHTFPSVLKAWWKSTPNPPCNVARHVQESRSKQHGCFVTAPTVREERRRARAFVGVRDLQERGFFSTLRENERLWEENGWRKRKIYEWILFCFALTLFFVYFGSPCLLACCETIMYRGGKSFVIYNLEGSFRRKLC